MNLPLSYFGSPVLREVAEPVTTFDDSLKKLSQDMIDTMREEAGIGLAGPQVGKRLRIFVMDVPPDMDVDEKGQPYNPLIKNPLVVINPEIKASGEDEEEMEEGCLSIPEVRGKVQRPFSIEMTFQDVGGESREIKLYGLAARCAQHENDHLNGVLFIDYLSSVKKMSIKGKLKRMKQNYHG